MSQSSRGSGRISPEITCVMPAACHIECDRVICIQDCFFHVAFRSFEHSCVFFREIRTAALEIEGFAYALQGFVIHISGYAECR